ncbi:class I SAM-dependent methyltransferase [Nocardia sp. NPDC060249]|uniref:class I SAM-dependent methyltransferase n=1 Tax=Nocardia sp. NPDC060249 TaxID=3347082 RepID=UPI00365A3208
MYATRGSGYTVHRAPDPTVERLVRRALGDARTVVNVGAGSGSYEPSDRVVVAVEPSLTMIRQRSPLSASVVRARAEDLPIPDKAFDVAMATMTVHLWGDAERGLAELRRVSNRQVVLTWDQSVMNRFWLVRDYFPDIAVRESGLAASSFIESALNNMGADVRSTVVPVPSNCTDGFLGAYWRRPRAYLDDSVRRSISIFHALDGGVIAAGVEKLDDDLRSGRWTEDQRNLLGLRDLDLGYRLLCT